MSLRPEKTDSLANNQAKNRKLMQEYFEHYKLISSLLVPDVARIIAEYYIASHPAIFVVPLFRVDCFILSGSPKNELESVEPYFWLAHLHNYSRRVKKFQRAGRISRNQARKFFRLFHGWRETRSARAVDALPARNLHFLGLFLAGLCDEKVFEARLKVYLHGHWGSRKETLRHAIEKYKETCQHRGVAQKLGQVELVLGRI